MIMEVERYVSREWSVKDCSCDELLHRRDAETQRSAEEIVLVDREQLNSLSAIVVDAAMQVHMVLGPGLLENAYKACLVQELRSRGLHVETEVPLPIYYKGVRVDAAFRIDLLVEHELIVELKSIANMLAVHEAQLLSHLRFSGKRLGLLINFNVARLQDGIKRRVNHL
jgi:GxxExxY protein